MANLFAQRALHHRVVIAEIRWLCEDTFELVLEKPPGFSYLAGQKILCGMEEEQREYSLASGPADKQLLLCIRLIKDGSMSKMLSQLSSGDQLAISDAYGFLLHRPGKSILIATGTGIAPFAGYYRDGVTGAIVLHGVKKIDELYYRKLFTAKKGQYIPCLTAESDEDVASYAGFNGRVTEYVDTQLEKGTYNFYLSGNGQMIRDVMQIIDLKFPESRIFTELFF